VRPDDTSPEAAAIMHAAWRDATPVQRVARAIALTRLAHAFALAQIRDEYPNEDERTHRLRLAARIIPPALMRAAFDWPPRDGDG
jgi:hypothetical protein